MTAANPDHVIPASRFRAWLFDLDGVVTATSTVHGKAWKQSFDEYLRKRATRENVPFEEFQMEPEFYEYVDGKPRYEGVDSFLRSRGIELPWGDNSDGPEDETVCGIGNKKNLLFNKILAEDGVDPFPTSVELIRTLRAKGVKIAVVSSSKNCPAILEATNTADLIDMTIDGLVAEEEKIAGKPEPDTFLAAADHMGFTAAESVVIEDAVSGVQAGRAGKFGLVIGVARHDDPQLLLDNGADIVVSDLGELTITD